MKHLFFFFLLLSSLSSNAQVKHTTNVNKYGVAINGYDPQAIKPSKVITMAQPIFLKAKVTKRHLIKIR
jgi:hypothetical protein